ncbi:MAG TPA: cupin domain-containing protein [Xanthobacteraceae bacterium]|nr:cupin domain-containing protein [Xanthobacteraceae bacterium]
MNPVDVSTLQMLSISSPDDASINWTAAFACYGGKGADNTVVVPFSIAPGGHLGWHTDSLEETQYIIAGHGELLRDDGSWAAGPGSIFVLPKDVRHDLRNVGTAPLLAVAFFSGEALTQTFDSVMLPPKGHILSSPNAAA